MPENVRKILSEQGLNRPGIIDTNTKCPCVIQHFEDLGRAHILAWMPPVLAKAATQIASGIYAMREHERPFFHPHLPERPEGRFGTEGSHAANISFGPANLLCGQYISISQVLFKQMSIFPIDEPICYSVHIIF